LEACQSGVAAILSNILTYLCNLSAYRILAGFWYSVCACLTWAVETLWQALEGVNQRRGFSDPPKLGAKTETK
jgi:hypothetical protein